MTTPTGYFLLDHRNPHGEHFYRERRGSVLAYVVHITAGLEDLDGIADHSAEQTARYAAGTDRKVSWHSGSDSDSALDLLPTSFTAWHCEGYNTRTAGHEISKAGTDWRGLPGPWVDATLRRAAEHLRPKAVALGIPFRKATKAELDRAIATNGAPVGFIGHAELDPLERSDPGLVRNVGDTFPWSRFLSLLTGPTQEVPAMFRPDDVVATIETPTGGGRWELTFDGGIRTEGDAKFFGSIPGLPESSRLGFRGAMILRPYRGGYEVVDLKGNSYHFPPK